MSKKLLMLMSVLLLASFAGADLDIGEDYKVPDIPPIKVMEDGKEVVITLADAFEYHGHPCPGVCIGFRALTYAIEHLWGDTIPEREDLIVFSRGPMCGVVDVFTLVTYGDSKVKPDTVTQATPGPPIPKGMIAGRDKFWFTIVRKSTGDALDIRVNGGLFPKDFFSLKKKVKSKKASDAEKEQLDAYKREMVRAFPTLPVAELFEKLVRYQVIMWGI
ncbi:MAG: formylmethanofuran dehydrogenase subunit E family protein [Candidatus Latescibacteria bacterium]|nr:formylmethanofuran dehydrogenase subunit E family protein [Candidatus Latescibacterota bacterium]